MSHKRLSQIDSNTGAHTQRSLSLEMAAAIGLNGVKVGTTSSQAYLDGKTVKETKALLAELCRHFYGLGWVLGTGGSISIKVHDDSIPKPQQLILMSPSGILYFLLILDCFL